MRPALITHFVPGRGVEPALKKLLESWDGDVIGFEHNREALEKHGVPMLSMAEFQTPAMIHWASEQAARRRECLLPRLAETVAVNARPEWTGDTRSRVESAMAALFDTPHFTGNLELVNLQTRKVAQERDLQLLFLSDSYWPSNRLMLLTARMLGVPSLELAHGVPGFNYSPHTRTSACDHVAVYSEYMKTRYLGFGAEAETVAVTGNPAWDRQPGPPQLRRQLLARLQLDPDRPVICYGMTWSYDALYLHVARAVLDVFTQLASRHPEWQFLLRVHPMAMVNGIPRRTLDELYQRYRTGALPTLRLDTLPVQQSMLISDVVVSCASGLVNDAILAGNAVVVENIKALRTTRYEENIEVLYGTKEAVLQANTTEQLEDAVESAVTCAATRENLAGARLASVRCFNHADDNNATARVVTLMRHVMSSAPRAMSPELPESINRQGESLFQEGRIKEALTCFVEACQRAPYNALFRNNIAAVLVHLGKTEQALEHLQQAHQIDPASEAVRENLNNLLATQPHLEFPNRTK